MGTSTDAKPPHADVGGDAQNLVDTYVAALAAGDPEPALATLSPDTVLQSPFHTWRARHLPNVFRARCAAFADLRIEKVIHDADAAAIHWRATVDGCSAQAAELVAISDGAICRIDIFVRPADVLETVERAMVRAWPR